MREKLFKLELYPLIDDDDEIVDRLISSCFNDGDQLLLLCHREDSLLFSDEALELRKRVPIELQKFGQYQVVYFIDPVRFSAVAEISYSEYSMNTLRMAWTYF